MNYPFVDQILVPFFIRFFFVFGIISLAIGAGLIFNSMYMHKFFEMINHWVTMRSGMKWFAIPRNTGIAGQHLLQGLIGMVFMTAAVFSAFVLSTQDVASITDSFDIEATNSYASWLIDSVRWFLIAGSMLVITVGLMMVFFQKELRAIEAHTNHWYSFRNYSQGCDTMHMAFDRWVESYPRVMGCIITTGALFVVINYGLLLFIPG